MEQPWVYWLTELPNHPSVRLGAGPDSDSSEQMPIGRLFEDELSKDSDFVLKVSRPQLKPAPEPPPPISGWLEPGWEEIDGSVVIREPSKATEHGDNNNVASFNDDQERVKLFGAWEIQRNSWVQAERPAYEAWDLYVRLFGLHSEIEREAERVELVLGEGILNWRLGSGGIHHPVLLQRVELSFDPEIPEFTIYETEHPVELYSSLFAAVPEVEGSIISRFRSRLEQDAVHPLGQDTTSSFLLELVQSISSKGQFIEDGAPEGELDYPRIGRAPVLFVRTRVLGFAAALEAIIEHIQDTDILPDSLLRIVGIDCLQFEDDIIPLDAMLSGGGNEDEQVLFTKPANVEQLQIAQRLERHGAVLVQGPPGTGKTHTIANLVGDLLAKGASVLVTSHTAKALKVLRDKVSTDLQPLCISVLGNDIDSRDQLKSAVADIVSRLNQDPDRLARDAMELRKQRNKILSDLREARRKILHARLGEYEPLVLAGESYSPADAARAVAAGQEEDGWVPNPVVLGTELPLTEGELTELYHTNVTVSPDVERELSLLVPDPQSFPTPAEFGKLLELLRQTSNIDHGLHDMYWEEDLSCPVCGTAHSANFNVESLPCRHCGADIHTYALNPETLIAMLSDMQSSVQTLQPLTSEKFKLEAAAAGWRSGPHREGWDKLLSSIEATYDLAGDLESALIEHRPQLAPDMAVSEQKLVIDQIISHLEEGKRLGALTSIAHRSWSRLIRSVSTSGRKPDSLDQFEALGQLASLELARQEMIAKWEMKVTQLGGPNVEDLGSHPERALYQYCPSIQACLDWYEDVWIPIHNRLIALGFRWDELMDGIPPVAMENGDLLRLRTAVVDYLPNIIAVRAAYLKHRNTEAFLQRLHDDLVKSCDPTDPDHVANRLAIAVRDRDAELYSGAFEHLIMLHRCNSALRERQQYLIRLEQAAPGWASAIRNRIPPHDGHALPGNPSSAWKWIQLNCLLDMVGADSPEALQRRVYRLTDELHRVTAKLVEHLAWGDQIRHINAETGKRQALIGWLQTVNTRGFQHGKRAGRLRVEARKLMEQSKSSVPVWIMPLSRVVENFDPRVVRFDVVIIDEASQSDLMGLIAFYLGKKVIVVGDDEQVSPDAVGERLDETEQLINMHLQGIPNNHLYTGQMSVYHLANTSFGGTIRLREHFRCVPDIISFSNHLSYNGEIRPLRDSSSSIISPQVIECLVPDGMSEEGTNETEAMTVASLVVAAAEQREYRQLTFGVIAMVGDEKGKNSQAAIINSLIVNKLHATEFVEHKIMCGNAPQFQGDERHVMFLSMVDGPPPSGDKLSLRREERFKKRFNVSASRACDQMWVVHSLDPESDLQPDDLRYRLIQHARDPQALGKLLESGEGQTESELERQVLRRLVSEGYRVVPQWKVGNYRIDMVVIGGDGTKLAIECDGDRYHTLDTLEQDMVRQAVLERRDWVFSRIRGSAFFRNPDKAMEPVFERLHILGIDPTSQEAAVDAPTEDFTDPVVARVMSRAAELRQEWTRPRQ